MKVRTLLLSLVATSVIAITAPSFAQTTAAPHTVNISGAVLVQIRKTQDPAIVKSVRTDADKALRLGPWSVTLKKTMPVGDDKHDYMSMGRYFWPNPDTPNHLPYVRHDGRTNPEIKDLSDEEYLHNTAKYARMLGLAYYLTGDERYAEHCALLIRHFFLDPETKMNPNLQHAQYVPGVNDGRGTGILDARDLPDVGDAATLIAGSKSWTKADDDALHAWFEEYFTWLTTSKHGQQEANAANNHGSWYGVQATGIALYLGKDDMARKLIDVSEKRMNKQFKPDGSQPLELARTNSLHYSAFNLEALAKLAEQGENLGIHLWTEPAPAGSGSMRDALEYLLPATQGKPWVQKDIDPSIPSDIRLILIRAALRLNDAKYYRIAKTLPGTLSTDELLYENQLPASMKK